MYWHQFDVARAVIDSGMRATVGQPILEFPGAPDGARPEHAAEGIEELRSLGPRVGAALTPHAHYSVSEPSLRLIAEISDAKQVPMHTHLSETEQEVHDCVDAHGCRRRRPRPARASTSVRCRPRVWVEEELALIGERGDHRHQPRLEHEAAVGRAFPYPETRKAGVALGLGTDCGSNNPRPACRHEDVRAAAEARGRRPASSPIRSLGDRDQPSPGLGGTRSSARLPTSCSSTPPAPDDLRTALESLVYATTARWTPSWSTGGS
jgi:hypothetical protein